MQSVLIYNTVWFFNKNSDFEIHIFKGCFDGFYNHGSRMEQHLCAKTKGFINEIIEIGAVKLDENLNFKDKFSCLIKPQIGKKLRGSVKELTNITNEEVRSGEPFTKVFSSFRRWVGSESILLTWGDGDIRVLIDNYKYLNGIDTIPFLSYYADMQAYIQSVLGTPKSRQIGLSAAAQELGVDESAFSHHRAYDDSLLSAECLKKVYSKSAFKPYVRECNDEFYARLSLRLIR